MNPSCRVEPLFPLLLLFALGCPPGFKVDTPVDEYEGISAEAQPDEEEEDPPEDEGQDEDSQEDEDVPEGEGEGDEAPVDEDAAVLVAVDLPTEIECGGTYLASVRMQNTGSATWTRADGYKLGGVDDTDPLHGPDARIWLDEDVAVLPGESHLFVIELNAPVAGGDYLTDWRMVHEEVRWFGETTSQTVAVACGARTFCDTLTDGSTATGFADKDIRGGSFSEEGWQTTTPGDQIRLEMSTGITGSGTVEIDVTNFDPATQYAGDKHQIINMYTSENGSQDVFDTDEAWWNIRTGTNYSTGFKVLAAPNGGDSREEARLIEDATWNPDDLHTFIVEWDAGEIHIYLDGEHMQTLPYSGRARPLQHLFIGTDNVYTAQVGPIYSNLCVTQ